MLRGIPAQSPTVCPCCMLVLAPHGVCAIIVGRQNKNREGAISRLCQAINLCVESLVYCLHSKSLEDVMQVITYFCLPQFNIRAVSNG